MSPAGQNPTFKTLFDDAIVVFNDFRKKVREPAQDVVTTYSLGEIVADIARPLIKLDWLAPVRRVERQLETIERRTARLEDSLARPPLENPVQGNPERLSLSRENFAVTTRPTTGERYEVLVQGEALDDRPELVFTQNGRERRARILDSGGGAVRGEVALKELEPGPWDVMLEQGGRQLRLTTVEVGGN